MNTSPAPSTATPTAAVGRLNGSVCCEPPAGNSTTLPVLSGGHEHVPTPIDGDTVHDSCSPLNGTVCCA